MNVVSDPVQSGSTEPPGDAIVDDGAAGSNSRKRTRSLESAVNSNSFIRILSKKEKKLNKLNRRSDKNPLTDTVSQSQPTKRTCLKSLNTATRSIITATENDAPLCVFCGEPTFPTDSIRCDFCTESYHLTCCSIDIDCHSDLISLTNFLGWTCRACRFDSALHVDALKKSVADLSVELKNLRSSLPLAVSSCISRTDPVSSISQPIGALPVGALPPADLPPTSIRPPVTLVQPGSGSLPLLTTSAPATSVPDRDLYSDVIKLVTKTIVESDRRKLNLIVSGLPESNPSLKTDGALFLDVSNKDLKLNLNGKIAATKRIGKIIGSKPRRLLVTFTSAITAADVYSRARDLRHSLDIYTANNIYINLDLSREQSRIAYLKRVQRRDPSSLNVATTNNHLPFPRSLTNTPSLDVSVVSRSRTYYRSSGNKVHPRPTDSVQTSRTPSGNAVLSQPANIEPVASPGRLDGDGYY